MLYEYKMARLYPRRLHDDIEASAISTGLVQITARGSGDLNALEDPRIPENASVEIEFAAKLSVGDETLLNSLVSGHVPESMVKKQQGRFAATIHAQKAGVPYMIDVPTGASRGGAFKANLSDNLSSNCASINPVAYTETGFVVEVEAISTAVPIILDFAWEIERH